MLLQLALGALLIVAATMIQVCFISVMVMTTPAVAQWLKRISILRFAVVIAVAGLWTIAGQLAGVWVWATVLIWVDAFPNLEVSLYFSLSAYTTLGFGDVLPPEEWRLLGALIGANGMLGFGLAIAVLVEFVTGVKKLTGE